MHLFSHNIFYIINNTPPPLPPSPLPTTHTLQNYIVYVQKNVTRNCMHDWSTCGPVSKQRLSYKKIALANELDMINTC